MEYKTYNNIKIPQNLSPEKQAVVDEIARNYIKQDKIIKTDHMNNMARIALGSLVSGASFHPILNIPYVGTGLGGALYDAGQAMVEGDKLGDIAKRAGRGFAIGETVGAVPYVGKAAGKTKAGQAVGKQFDKVAKEVAANPAVQKAYDALMSDVKAFNPNKQTAYHGSPYDFEKFSNEAIGTGEGAQAHGYGHYAALNKKVAENYADTLSGEKPINLEYKNNKYEVGFNPNIMDWEIKGNVENLTPTERHLFELIDSNRNLEDIKNKEIKNIDRLKRMKLTRVGRRNRFLDAQKSQDVINILNSGDLEILPTNKQLYKLSVPKDDVMLREDLFYKEQNPQVQNAIKKLYEENWENYPYNSDLTQILYTDNTKAKYGQNAAYKEGRSIYDALTKMTGSEQEASKLLNKYGIKGISYNGGIDGEARVIFNPDDIDIVRKYYNQPNLKDIYNKFINSGTFAGAITNP